MRLALAAILGLTVLAYWPSMDAPFVYDDWLSVQRNAPALEPPSMEALTSPRGLFTLSLQVSHALGGYHGMNLAVHMVNVALVYAILAELALPAAIGAGVFALHPIQTESVIYTSARSETLAALFIFAGIWVYLHFVERYPLRTWGLVACCTFAGLLAKETAVLLPVAIMALQWFGVRKVRFSAAIPIVGLGALALAWASVATSSGGLALDYYAVQPYVFWRHLGQLLWPALSLAWAVEPSALAMVAAWVAALLATPICLSNAGVALFVATFAARSIVPMPDLMVEHRMYVPMLGIAMLAAYLYSKFQPKESHSYACPLPLAYVSRDRRVAAVRLHQER